MSTESHIAALRQRHTELDQRIHNEEAHPAHDPVEVTRLKQEKLRLKDEIQRLTQP
jgi:hypothetical protein